jgi:hypothetical protein
MTGLKQQADMVDRFVELGVRRRHTAGKPVYAGSRKPSGDHFGGGEAGLVQDE